MQVTIPSLERVLFTPQILNQCPTLVSSLVLPLLQLQLLLQFVRTFCFIRRTRKPAAVVVEEEEEEEEEKKEEEKEEEEEVVVHRSNLRQI